MKNMNQKLKDEIKRVVFRLQNGLCAICYSQLDSKAHLDHDHSTNKIRGILCANCNTGLGMFRDRISILLNAIEYLKKTNTVQ